MAWLALAYTLQGPASPAPSGGGWLATGRLVDAPTLHLGVRPAIDIDRDSWGIGATVQVTLAVL